jgi:hypothetical protein
MRTSYKTIRLNSEFQSLPLAINRNLRRARTDTTKGFRLGCAHPHTTMVLHNPNNWHWVNKDVAPWAKDYLEKELSQVSAEQDGVSAKIDKVVSMDGDVDVSQRKGKVITIFDVVLKLEYSGT